jgi:hypothetical protein
MNARDYLGALRRVLIEEGIRGNELKPAAIEVMLAELVVTLWDIRERLDEQKSCNCKPKTLTTKSK